MPDEFFERKRYRRPEQPRHRRPGSKASGKEIFQGMKYVTGFKGDDPQFSVPLEADGDGLLGRECPADQCSPKFFKIAVPADDADDHLTDASITCPYCGTKEPFQEFHTQAQINYTHDLVQAEMEKAIVRSLRKSTRRLNSIRGPIQLRATVTANLPTIRHYVEDKLKRQTTCEQCQGRYAVYGVSYHCPFCGGGALTNHLRESAATIRVLATEAANVGQRCGQDACDRMLGNAYEDAVTLFEGFLKLIYRYGVRKRCSPQEAERLESKIGTSFQRLNDAELLLQRDLQAELFRNVSTADRDRLAIVFSKRHVMTHNLGLVDTKYANSVQAIQKPGQEVSMDSNEIAWSIDIIEAVLGVAAQSVGV